MWSGNKLLQWLSVDGQWVMTVERCIGYVKLWGWGVDTITIQMEVEDARELVEEAYCYQS